MTRRVFDITSQTSQRARFGPSPARYVPQHVASKIVTSGRALQGERKQLTVLFVDVKGSMTLAESLDPEV